MVVPAGTLGFVGAACLGGAVVGAAVGLCCAQVIMGAVELGCALALVVGAGAVSAAVVWGVCRAFAVCGWVLGGLRFLLGPQDTRLFFVAGRRKVCHILRAISKALLPNSSAGLCGALGLAGACAKDRCALVCAAASSGNPLAMCGWYREGLLSLGARDCGSVASCPAAEGTTIFFMRTVKVRRSRASSGNLRSCEDLLEHKAT